MARAKQISSTQCLSVVYLSLGSNQGDREKNIEEAITRISRINGVKLKTRSSLHETASVGGPPQPYYYNAAVKIETSIQAETLLDNLMRIEEELGRVRDERWGPRT
ncbi:MAG: 2-amino-4-hydroxy-6-hydroxymethyldihydropteridine diphosphokinase, partial [Planctomycetota bacterium]